MHYREPRRILGVRDRCCMGVEPQAFPIGMGIFADYTYFVAPLCVTVNGSKDPVYLASHFVLGYVRASG